MGKYIYVGKFNGNNDYLHFSQMTAYKNKSGILFMSHLPIQTVRPCGYNNLVWLSNQ